MLPKSMGVLHPWSKIHFLLKKVKINFFHILIFGGHKFFFALFDSVKIGNDERTSNTAFFIFLPKNVKNIYDHEK